MTPKSRTMLWIAAVLAVAGVAALVRVVPLGEEVFAPDGVVLQGNDPWYHLRLCEHLAANFPAVLGHDPLALHPGGQHVLVAPGLDALVVGFAALRAGGRPASEQIAEAAAWVPPLLAALAVVAAAVLGSATYGRRAGLVAAALLAIAPGPFLRYSVLGYADHHVLEALLATLTVLTLGRAADAGRLGFYLLGGVLLAAYLLTWVGGGFLVGILGAWTGLTLILRRDGRYRPLVHALIALAVAAAILAGLRRLGSWVDVHLAVLGAAAVGLAALAGATRLARRTHRPVLVAIGLILIVAAAGAVLAGRAPGGLRRFAEMLSWFAQGSREALVQEAAPLFRPPAGAWWGPAWELFGLAGLLAMVGLVEVASRLRRKAEPAGLHIAVFGLATVAATLIQQRFAYYAAVPMSVLAAGGLVAMHGWIAGAATARGGRRRFATAAVIVLAGACFVGHAWHARAIVTQPSGPASDWREALRWLKTNSPEPDASPYGVMCTWDRGYWVTALAGRAPNANPTQANAGPTAAYFLSESEAEAVAILEAMESRYVVLDCTVPIWPGPAGRLSIGKIANLARWGGRDPEEFFEIVGASPEAASPSVLVFHPAYYRSMVARLFVFGGEAYEPQGEAVLVQLRDSAAGGGRRFVHARRRFPSHADAQAFLAGHAAESWQLVGLSPTESCVPLEALRRHRLVHRSPTTVAQRGERRLGYVQVFEVLAR